MLGAIVGDVVGSVFEIRPCKRTDFELLSEYSTFTDDTVMSVAVAETLLTCGDYAANLRRWGRKYPGAGYGGNFKKWFMSDESGPYGSWGNGSAMRVSPVGFLSPDLESTLTEAKRSAEVTHNHPEGVKGAQAVAAAVFLARTGRSKQEIKEFIVDRFAYDLDRRLDDIRPRYRFDVSCQGSVPEAILAFLEGNDLEDAIRKAISLGGDSDTLACMAGGIAEAFYGGVPTELARVVRSRLTPDLLAVTDQFYDRIRHG